MATQVENDQLSLISSHGIESSSDRIESLRKILELEQGRPIPYEEATEVGQSLISFFEALAEGSS